MFLPSEGKRKAGAGVEHGEKENTFNMQIKLLTCRSSIMSYLLPKPVGLFCAKALFWDEKRLVPVLVVPNKLFDVPVDVPNPKPVLVEVAG